MTIKILEFIRETLPDPKDTHAEDFILEAESLGKTRAAGMRAFRDWNKLLVDTRAEIDEEIEHIKDVGCDS